MEQLETQLHTAYKPEHCFAGMMKSKKLPREISAYNYNLNQLHRQTTFKKSVPLLEEEKSMAIMLQLAHVSGLPSCRNQK